MLIEHFGFIELWLGVGFFAVLLAAIILGAFGYWDSPPLTQQRKGPLRPESLPPIDATGWTFYVDATNLCKQGESAYLRRLDDSLERLRARFPNGRFVCVCDDGLKYLFPEHERERFDSMLGGEDFIEAAHSGAECLQRARGNVCSVVVSNDWFKHPFVRSLRRNVPLLRMDRTAMPLHPRSTFIVYKNRYKLPLPSYIPSARYIQKANNARF